MNFKYLEVEEPVYECRFNPECACENLQCARCGWNPVVAEARTKAILERMKKEDDHE